MAKIELISANPFKPYKLLIENENEHNFLEGLFCASPEKKKQRCRGFNEIIDNNLYELIKTTQE